MLGALAVFLIVAGWSYASAITASGTEGLQAKSVEWVRSHGGSGIVRWVENEWYSHHQPPKGGRANVAVATHKATTFSSANYANVAHLPVPSALRPIVPDPVDGEGQWTPVGRLVGGVPAVYTTYLRPDPVHTSLLTGVAWMDTKLLKATLFSGTDVPGVPGFKDVAPPTAEQASQLVAQFNSGFRMQDSDGGYYSEGRLIYTMRPGAASLVIYDTGKVTVAKWGRDATMGPNVVSVRQNLDLIIDQGHLSPGLHSDSDRQVGRHPRQQIAGVEVGRRGDGQRGVALCRRPGSQRLHVGQRAPPRRRHPGHGDGHQHLLGRLLLLHPGVGEAGRPGQRFQTAELDERRPQPVLRTVIPGLHLDVGQSPAHRVRRHPALRRQLDRVRPIGEWRPGAGPGQR